MESSTRITLYIRNDLLTGIEAVQGNHSINSIINLSVKMLLNQVKHG